MGINAEYMGSMIVMLKIQSLLITEL